MTIKENLTNFIKKKNSITFIMIVAFVGIALISISELIPQKSEVITQKSTNTDYSIYLENKIYDIVKAITGEDSPIVMLTLCNDGEKVFANDTNEKLQNGENSESEIENNYVIIRNSDGSESAILLSDIKPKVAGIVVISSYAGNINLKESIISAIMTALDLPSNKVCVETKSN